MAHRRSSIKKIRIDKRRREHNVQIISELKTVARKVNASLVAKKADEALTQSRELFSKLDKAVSLGLPVVGLDGFGALLDEGLESALTFVSTSDGSGS